MKTPYQTTFDEQVAGLDPETKATHRRMLTRQRQKSNPRSSWWFEQMRKAVGKAPGPSNHEGKYED